MLLTILLAVIIYTIFRSRENGKYSIISSFVVLCGITVGTAEILSVFNAWNKIYIFIVWITFAVIIYITQKNKIVEGIKNSKQDLHLLCNTNISKLEIIWLMMILTITALILARGLLYPSQNGDSMTYHCSRSFLYYKNQSIHNMPFSYKWGLYTGPFTAIVMAQMRIFLQGSDRLCNLIQFPAWILGGISIYEIGKIIGLTKKKSLFAALLFYTLPLLILQAATTQCDLFAGVMVLLTIFYFVQISQKNQAIDFWLAGISGGIAMLTKVTNALPLFVAGIIFLLLYNYRYTWKCGKARIILIGLGGVVINIGYWIRNAIDLNGDIFAIRMSRTMGESIQQSLISRLLLNYSYLYGSTNRTLSNVIDKVVLEINRKIENNNILFGGYTSYSAEISHDVYAFGLYMFLTWMILPLIIVFIYKKNKMGIYLCSGWYLMILLSAISFPFNPAGVRYMLPPIILSTLYIAYAMGCVFNKYSTKHRKKFTFLLIIFSVIIWGKAIQTNVYDYFQPLNRGWNEKSFDELRDWRYGHKWQSAISEYMPYITQKGFTKIGFYEEEPIGQYPILYEFREQKYQVAYVNSQYGSRYEEIDFMPECIISTEQSNKNEMTYKNKTYVRILDTFPIHENYNISLYLLNE